MDFEALVPQNQDDQIDGGRFDWLFNDKEFLLDTGFFRTLLNILNKEPPEVTWREVNTVLADTMGLEGDFLHSPALNDTQV